MTKKFAVHIDGESSLISTTAHDAREALEKVFPTLGRFEAEAVVLEYVEARSFTLRHEVAWDEVEAQDAIHP